MGYKYEVMKVSVDGTRNGKEYDQVLPGQLRNGRIVDVLDKEWHLDDVNDKGRITSLVVLVEWACA